MNIPNYQQTQNLQSPGVANKKHQAYKDKCELIDYHIHETSLINKALQSELKEYHNKIEFEKRVRKLLIEKLKVLETRQVDLS